VRSSTRSRSTSPVDRACRTAPPGRGSSSVAGVRRDRCASPPGTRTSSICRRRHRTRHGRSTRRSVRRARRSGGTRRR
jgi:hypothetical protein